MNIEALKKVRDSLVVMGVHPIKIDFSKNTTSSPFGVAVESPSFSRLQWTFLRQANSELANSTDALDNMPRYIVTFVVNALTELALMKDGKPLPSGEVIPPELLIAKIDIDFSIDYICSSDPAGLDVEGIGEFTKHNLPYHFWPYWRELIQSIAMRGQLSVPILPPYTVQEEARPNAQ